MSRESVSAVIDSARVVYTGEEGVEAGAGDPAASGLAALDTPLDKEPPDSTPVGKASSVDSGAAGSAPRRARRRRPPASYDGPLPTIRIVPGKIERVVNEAQAALTSASRGLYQRGGRVVSVNLVPAKAAHGREVSALQIAEREDYALREDMSVAAHFERFDGRIGEYVTTDPPMWIVNTLKGRAGRLRFPVLSGIISAPTLRLDGSILSAPGYDELTGLVFEPRGVRFPEIPERPTYGDIEQSYARLSELLENFPFVNESAKSVALSAILTGCIRASLPTAPMHGFGAPTAGTGKSKAVDIASIIALGHEAPVISPGAKEEEFEKRLVTGLLAGRPIVAIDNVKDGVPLESDFLC